MTHSSSAIDRTFRVLSHSYRRHALAALAAGDLPVTVRDVSNEVVAREYAAQLPRVPSDDVKAVYLSLVHVHVPLLEDAGLIEYDPDRKLIEGADLGTVRPFLSLVNDDPSAFEPAR